MTRLKVLATMYVNFKIIKSSVEYYWVSLILLLKEREIFSIFACNITCDSKRTIEFQIFDFLSAHL
jgi:hypothetical protein